MIIPTGAQLRAARAMLGWKQPQLAKRAKVSIGTVRGLEAQNGPLSGRISTIVKLVEALEAAGVIFTNGQEPGVKKARSP